MNFLRETFEGRCCRGRYERLGGGARTRRLFTMRRFRGVRMSRFRKLNWKPFWIGFVLARKIGELVKRMKMDEACPAIVFSSQFGLPVLSHSSVGSRKSCSLSYNSRSLTWL